MKITDLFRKTLNVSAVAMLIAVAAVVPCARAGVMDKMAGGKGASLSDNQQPVELNGDTVEYKADEGKFVASGNVVAHQKDGATLYCDRIEFFRDRQEGTAYGHVVLESDKGTIWAEKAFYNFLTKKGEFTNARLISNPVYAWGATISKIRDNYYVMSDGYFTTSDYDDPEWRVKSRHIEIFLGDKAVAHNSTMYFGGVPVMHMPKYVQDLHKNRPHFSVIPGYKKDWGGFLLTSYRVYPAPGVETVYYVDARERKGMGYGLDVILHPTPFGDSLFKAYYLDERTIAAHHIYQAKAQPTVVEDRYRYEWRHKWDITPQTSAILQYYVLSDSNILKDYFERQYRTDQAPDTYMLLTHSTATSSLSFRMDKRVNRFETKVERLPEVSYAWNNQQIADTGFYFKSTDTAVALDQRTPGATDLDHQTTRLLTDNEISRPFKAGIFELRPFTGTEHTFYTHSLDKSRDDSIRSIFRTGMDASTKFYRIYDVQFNRFGVEINNLRHVLTPTVSYLYQHRPTMSSADLYQFDAVDSRAQIDAFSLGLESKFQTKRDGKSVDIVRSLLTTQYRMKDDPAGQGFAPWQLTDEFVLNKYVTFIHDFTWDPNLRRVTAANESMHLTDGGRWDFDITSRGVMGGKDVITTQLDYKFNPKWRGVVYERLNDASGAGTEQQFSLVRDLHSWEMEFSYKSDRGYETNSGSEVMVIFRLKAFPSFGLNGSKGFLRQKAGSQAP